MLLRMIEEGLPVDEAVFFDMGEVEFECMHVLAEKMRAYLEARGIKFTVLHPKETYTYLATQKEFGKRDGRFQTGYWWCGGKCRWATAKKLAGIEKYLKSLGRDDIVQYVGIAVDESQRIFRENKSRFPKEYPLITWDMTEADCLRYCHERGWTWEVYSEPLGRNVDLYGGILDRVSCYCCRNKNLKELYNLFRFLPDYWKKLEDLQRMIPMPYRRDGKTIFDLRERFEKQSQQMDYLDLYLKEVNKESS